MRCARGVFDFAIVGVLFICGSYVGVGIFTRRLTMLF